jgi:fructuronate reductase
MLRRLSEATAGPATRPPVGIVHLGAGAFHRAHQAAFTEDAGGWGICAVAPRRRDAVEQLAPQDGLFTLLVRHPDEDRARVIGCLREVLHAPSEPERVVARIADPSVHVVTLTITEAGYASPVVDLLARGLARRDAPLTVISCDNLPRNGEVLERLVGERDHVTFPCTVVDRIVPATTEADREAAARLTGFEDRAAVVAEVFRQWVIEDRFAGPRPAWEQAGAQLVADSAPYEQLKLRLLNGSHLMLAYLGLLAGARTVDEAVRDEAIAGAVQRLVSEDVAPTLAPELDVPGYVAALHDRFANPRMGHRLVQIAADGSQKLPARLLPVARERLAAGAEPRWVALVVAAWALHLRGRAVHDDGAAPVREALSKVSAPRDSADAVLRALDPHLAADQVFRDLVADWIERLSAPGGGPC